MKSISFIFGCLLLVSYLLPWVVTPGISAMTNSAFDFAEWLSIHPLERADGLLLTPLLLRLPLACIALYLCLDAFIPRWVRILALLLLALAQMPPPEFFRETGGDSNYQQMAMLAAGTLVLGIGVLSLGTGRTAAYQPIIRLFRGGLVAAGLLAAVIGTSQGIALMQSFGTGIQAGVGIFLFTGISIICLLMALRNKENRVNEMFTLPSSHL
jgi:hypothetical protein